MKLEEIKNQPEIIVLIGLPGSGKSTWRDKMLNQSHADYIVISSDDEIEQLAKADGTDYSSGFKKYIGKATAISKQKFKKAVNNNKNIIWDQTNLTPKKRKSIISQVPDHYKKIAVAFEVTQDELDNRLKQREQDTGKHIPPDVMKNMANSYIPPTKEEGFDEVFVT